MKKSFLIGLKDLKLMFRDRAALTFMLLAPFLLTLGMGFVTGRFSGRSSGISDIPVVVVNLDQQELGNSLENLFHADDLASLLEPTRTDDSEAAYQLIDSDQAAAAVIIPAGFTESIIPSSANSSNAQYLPIQIEVYANPSRPTSTGIITAIVDEFLARVEEERIRRMTTIFALQQDGSIDSQDVEHKAQTLFENADRSEANLITLQANTEGAAAIDFDLLSYFAPGMALMFLMYTVSYGGRSILAERTQGTLPRLLTSPTSFTQFLGGKIVGVFLMGIAQVGILIGASTLFFGVQWGDPLGVIALIIAAVFSATGWGMLITALARSPAQVANIGSATMLIFGILGGSFVNLDQLSAFLRPISKITPNAWGLDGFTTLALGGTLSNLMEPLRALLIMGILLFAFSAILFRGNELLQK